MAKDSIITHDDTPPKIAPVNPQDVLNLERGKLLQPTMELQWVERKVTVNNVQSKTSKFLQQKFIDLSTGKEEWHDVPFVGIEE